jgi:hypothetical protein
MWAQVGVIKDDGHGGKAFRKATDVIRIGRAWSAVAGDWTLSFGSRFKIGVKFTIIRAVIVDRRM